MIELVLWGIFPLLLSLAASALSARCVYDDRSVAQLLAAILGGAALLLADIMLVTMILGAFPTYVPYILVVTGLVVVGWQVHRIFHRA